MTTAVVQVYDYQKKLHKCRLLLDTCSTANFISEGFAKKLQLNKKKCSVPVGALNNMNTISKFSLSLTFKSSYTEYKKSLEFLTIDKIADLIPSEIISRESFKIPSGIKLADPEFYKPASVDMLLGTGPTLSLLCVGQIKPLQDHDLFLQKTHLGWVVGGEGSCINYSKTSRCLLSGLDFDMEKFWKLEERVIERHLSVNDQKCEDHFRKHTQRDNSGRFIVALPFKNDIVELGDSKLLARKFLNRLIKRFEIDKNFELEYTKVINEYIELGHLSPSSGEEGGYYLPHLAVTKESSNTTKLRVVFHASAKSTNQKSINDNLLTGPVIQDDLFSHLVRFRSHK